MTSQLVTESGGTLSEGKSGKGRKWRARLIEADVQGSSGYYSREVLESDGPSTWPQGTAVFFDHPGETERHDRPERSVKDLAGKIASTPAMEADGLYADIEFYSWAAPIIEEMASDVGMSIRASASVEESRDPSIRGPIVTSLSNGLSVDVVTKAGAGGRLVSLLESARANPQVDVPEVLVPLGEAMASDTSSLLDRAVRDAYGPDSWVSDYDPETAIVYYRREDRDGFRTWAEGYTVGNDGLSIILAGNPTEVRARTEYVPVASTDSAKESHKPPVAPAGSTPTHESEEDTMSTTPIEEGDGRARELQEALSRAERERDEAREAIAVRDRTDKAKAIVAAQAVEAGVTFTALEERGLLADLRAKEDGELDVDAFTLAVKEATTTKASEAGAGRVTGFGSAVVEGEDRKVTATESTAAALAAFGIPVQEV